MDHNPLPEYRIPEIGVVDGIVMIEDTEHTVHDGQRIKRTEVRPKKLGTVNRCIRHIIRNGDAI